MSLLLPYQDRWAKDFNLISQVINTALYPLDVKIEHVGSTAVKGLSAKPIIDMDIVFQEREQFDELKLRLGGLGYLHNGDQGVKDREVFKRKKYGDKHPILDSIHHHLYVCPWYSEELRRHIKFRDHLREDDSLRLAYERIKFAIAHEAKEHRKLYASLKETRAKEFIERILKLED